MTNLTAGALFTLLTLNGCGAGPQSSELLPQTTEKAITWQLTEQTDGMDGSKTQVLSESSSTSNALLEIDCSENKRDGSGYFSEIYFSGTGPIAWIYAGENGGKEKVRYKFEDGIVHEAFWFTGSGHYSFLLNSDLLKQMATHTNMSIEFSPGTTIAKFNLDGLRRAIENTKCGAARR